MINIVENRLPKVTEYDWPKTVYLNTRSKKNKDYYCLSYNKRKKKYINAMEIKKTEWEIKYFLKKFLVVLIWLECVLDLIIEFDILKLLKNIIFSVAVFDILN